MHTDMKKFFSDLPDLFTLVLIQKDGPSIPGI